MAQALYTVDDDVLALPLGLATYLAYYNTDWMSDLGYDARTATWEDLRFSTCFATDPVRGHVGLGLPTQASTLLSLLTSGGSEIIGEDGQYHFTDDAGIRATRVLQQIFTGDCGRVYDTAEEGLAWFSHSSAAIIVESSLRLPEIEQAVVEGRNFALGIEALPGPEGPGPTLWYGPGLTLIAPEGTRRQAAQSVMAWFFTPDAQMTWSRITKYLPVRRSLVELRSATASSPTERRLLELTLEAADSGAWVAWPRQTNRVTCRAALLQGLLALDAETPADTLIAGVANACNASIATGEVQP